MPSCEAYEEACPKPFVPLTLGKRMKEWKPGMMYVYIYMHVGKRMKQWKPGMRLPECPPGWRVTA